MCRQQLTCLLDNAIILVSVPVKAQLTDPLKVVGVGTAHLAKLLNHISGMYLNGNEGHNLQALQDYAFCPGQSRTRQAASLQHSIAQHRVHSNVCVHDHQCWKKRLCYTQQQPTLT